MALCPAERAAQLGARGDVGLHERLAQVVLDGSWAEEQAGPDLGVGEPFVGQTGDLRLPGGELDARVPRALADFLTGGKKLATGPLGNAAAPISRNMVWA